MEKDFEKDEKHSLDLKKTEAKMLVQEAEQAAAEAAAKAAEAVKNLQETKAKAEQQAREVKIAELGMDIKKNASDIMDASEGLELTLRTIEELKAELQQANSEVMGLERLIATRRAIIADLNAERVKLGGTAIDIDSKMSVTQQIALPSSQRQSSETPVQQVNISSEVNTQGIAVDSSLPRAERRRISREMVKELLENENK